MSGTIFTATQRALALTSKFPVELADGSKGYASAQDLRDFLRSQEGLWRVIGASGVKVDLTGSASETALATIAIPGGALGPNGILRITALFSYTNSVNNKTIRYRFGAGLGGTIFAASVLTTTATTRLTQTIQNRGAANSQIGGLFNGSLGGTANAVVTGAIDTTAAQDVVLSGQLANTGETISLESYIIEASYKA